MIGGRHTHHHGILAGASAGAIAVLVAFGLVLLAWHAVSGAVGEAVIVIVWAVTAVVIVVALASGGYALLWLRHRIRHPEVLSRQPVRAEVVTEAPAAIPAPSPVAELPAPQAAGELPAAPVQYITHNHFHGEDAVEAAIRGHLEGKDRDG